MCWIERVNLADGGKGSSQSNELIKVASTQSKKAAATGIAFWTCSAAPGHGGTSSLLEMLTKRRKVPILAREPAAHLGRSIPVLRWARVLHAYVCTGILLASLPR